VPSLFVLILSLSKIIEKITSNHKRTVIMSHQKIEIIVKKLNLLVQIIISLYYHIALSLH